jgi:hypothetical protein
MPRPMRKYKPFEITLPEVCFLDNTKGLAYAEFGIVKTYANKDQAVNKTSELLEKGYPVEMCYDHPYVIYISNMFH